MPHASPGLGHNHPPPPGEHHLSAAPLTVSRPVIGVRKIKRYSSNKSTVRSRDKYERDKQKRDPLSEFRIWLPESTIDRLLAGHPKLAAMKRTTKTFKTKFAALVAKKLAD